MKTINEKIEDHVNDFGKGSVAAMWVRAGANFAIPLAKAEGFMLAMDLLNERMNQMQLSGKEQAGYLLTMGIRRGILPADKKEGEE